MIQNVMLATIMAIYCPWGRGPIYRARCAPTADSRTHVSQTIIASIESHQRWLDSFVYHPYRARCASLEDRQ